MADEIEAELESKLGSEALQEKVKAKLAEYHGLITRDAALHIISLEVLGQRARAATIMQASGISNNFKIRVRVERIFPPKQSPRGGRAQRASISDHSGSGTLLCYDDACAQLDEELLAGDMIEAEPVRVKNGEFVLAPGGSIRRVQKGARSGIEGSEGIGNFEGSVKDFFGDFPYRKGGKEGGALMSTFLLSDGKDEARVVLWDSPGLKGVLEKGTSALIENGVRRGGEIHISQGGRLAFKRKKEEGGAEIEKIEIDEAAAKVCVFSCGKKAVEFGFDEACAHFGLLPLPDGISTLTAIRLKKDGFAGKKLPHSWLLKKA